MKNLLSLLCFVVIVSTIPSTNAFSVQEWGFEDYNTRLAYEYIEYQPKGIKRVELNFPHFVSIWWMLYVEIAAVWME